MTDTTGHYPHGDSGPEQHGGVAVAQTMEVEHGQAGVAHGGHADPAMTLRVYQHVVPGMQRDAAARAAEIVFGP